MDFGASRMGSPRTRTMKKHKRRNCWCGGNHGWFGARKREPKKRRPMSVEIHPELQKRLKICAAKLGMSRADLIEQFCLEGLKDKEFDWHALARLRKTEG